MIMLSIYEKLKLKFILIF